MMNKDMQREIVGWAISLGLVFWLVDGGWGLKLLLATAIATGASLAWKVQQNREILDNTNRELQRIHEQATRLEVELAELRRSGQTEIAGPLTAALGEQACTESDSAPITGASA